MSAGIVPSTFVTLTSQPYPGDVLLTSTDGLTEMVDIKNEPFGTERPAAEFQRIIALNPSASVDSIRVRLTGLCNAYPGSRMAIDDQTFLVAIRCSSHTMRPPGYE